MSPTPDALTQALALPHPYLGKDLVSLEMIRDLAVEGERVTLTLELSSPICPARAELEARVREVLLAQEGVSDVALSVGHRIRTTVAEPPPVTVPGGGLPIMGAGSPPPQPQRPVLRGVKNLVAVASGKGGVGKSTVACNLALALCQAGLKVGLIDADIHGPSIPGMLGIKGKPGVVNNRIVPLEGPLGLKVISMGFLVDDDEPAILRGPMVTKFLTQFVFQTDWGQLDYLLLDLPPGTGDVHLTLVQAAPVSGGVIVSTPQDVALTIAAKGLKMFEKVAVPIVGVVENMSYFACPDCDKRYEIFGHGGGRHMAAKLGVPFLGEIPLDPTVVSSGDDGLPAVASHPESKAAQAMQEIAAQTTAQLAIMAEGGDPLRPFNWDWPSDAGKPVWNPERAGNGPSNVPAGIRKVDDTHLGILWRDGVEQTLPLRAIRLDCRCAKCVDEMSGAAILQPDAVPADLTAKTINSVGVYAISIDWATNDCANIHSFDALRRLGDRMGA